MHACILSLPCTFFYKYSSLYVDEYNKKNMLGKMDRWDLGAIDELPSYSRLVIQTLVETMDEIEKEMKPRGRSASVQQTINEVIVCQTYT